MFLFFLFDSMKDTNLFSILTSYFRCVLSYYFMDNAKSRRACDFVVSTIRNWFLIGFLLFVYTKWGVEV